MKPLREGTERKGGINSPPTRPRPMTPPPGPAPCPEQIQRGDTYERVLRELAWNNNRIRTLQHGDITIKVQDGRPVLVEITTKHKPQS